MLSVRSAHASTRVACRNRSEVRLAGHGVTRPARLSDAALCVLGDKALIVLIRDAQASGDVTAYRRRVGVLVFGHQRNISRRVGLKVPPSDVEDVTAEVLACAIRSAFDGRSVGEFVNWLDTITRRQIAQFYRRRAKDLPVAGRASRDRDEDHRGIEPATDDETGLVEIRDAVDRALAGLNADHRRIVGWLVLEGRPARDAAREIPAITENNAHQIATRFRRTLRSELTAVASPPKASR